jgi:hypothetical protein
LQISIALSQALPLPAKKQGKSGTCLVHLFEPT